MLPNVPPELLELVLLQLSAEDLAAASAVCKDWRDFLASTTGEKLWKRLAREHLFVEDTAAVLPAGYRSWKHFFGERYQREQKWRKGSFDRPISSDSEEWLLSTEQWGRVLHNLTDIPNASALRCPIHSQ